MRCLGFAVLMGLGVGLAASSGAWAGEAPSAPAAGPKRAEFDRVFGEWKTIIAEARQLKEDYRGAAQDKRPEIEKAFPGGYPERRTASAHRDGGGRGRLPRRPQGEC